MLFNSLLALCTIICILITVAFFTLAERKIMGSIQRRYGPNVVGFGGLLQPFADGLKLLFKEILIPTKVNRFLYLLAPCATFSLSLINWAFIPSNYGNILIDSNYSLLYVYALMSLSIYGLILAGWISGSRYSFIGAIRASAQMLSYEVSISFIFLIIIIYTQTTNISDIIYIQHELCWLIFILFPLCVIMYISMLAETNRIPFDLPEAEAELVAGYNLEYSSIPFALFFLAEYGTILFNSALIVLLFCGGWDSVAFLNFIPNELIFIFKTGVVWISFIVVRATYPRYRFDQLIKIGWTVLFPITFSLALFYIFIAVILS